MGPSVSASASSSVFRNRSSNSKYASNSSTYFSSQGRAGGNEWLTSRKKNKTKQTLVIPNNKKKRGRCRAYDDYDLDDAFIDEKCTDDDTDQDSDSHQRQLPNKKRALSWKPSSALQIPRKSIAATTIVLYSDSSNEEDTEDEAVAMQWALKASRKDWIRDKAEQKQRRLRQKQKKKHEDEPPCRTRTFPTTNTNSTDSFPYSNSLSSSSSSSSSLLSLMTSNDTVPVPAKVPAKKSKLRPFRQYSRNDHDSPPPARRKISAASAANSSTSSSLRPLLKHNSSTNNHNNHPNFFRRESETVCLIDTDDEGDDKCNTNDLALEKNPNDDHDVIHVDTDDDQDDDSAAVAADTEECGVVRSVFDSANHLSAHVLNVMSQWGFTTTTTETTANTINQSNAPPPPPPPHMIVDGAVALSHVSTPTINSASSTSTWISAECIHKLLSPAVTLSNYQLVGVNWLALLHSLTVQVNNGSTASCNVHGILADEMGLGKTVQTIAFLRYLKYLNHNNKVPSTTHLIVVPSSVLANWMREFQLFAPDLRIVKFYAKTECEKAQLQEQISRSFRNNSTTSIDVILAPVSHFQKENATERHFLTKRLPRFDYLVVDEGHVLKNAKVNRYKALDKIPSRRRLLLTGTPVQNSPKDLFTLLCFLMPKFFLRNGKGESDNNDSAAFLLLQQQLLNSSSSSTGDEDAYAKLKQLFAPFVLRRRKVDVLHQLLPPKQRHVEFVDLEPSSRAVYDSIIEEHLLRLKQQKKLEQPQGNGVGRSIIRGESSHTPQHVFTQLRKAAHHPLLLRTRYQTATEKQHLARCFHQYGAFLGQEDASANNRPSLDRVAQELEHMSDFEIHLLAHELRDENPIGRATDLFRYILSQDDLFASAKFKRLRTLLPTLIRDGHRVLIFSMWTKVLDLLGCLMETLSVSYLRMDGTTPVLERQALMDTFNNDPASFSVFLLSTKACGLGVNLTSADVCIIHDLDFNPFNDLQAEDRCHRIGQKKTVSVYKLVTRNTVDEDIFRMQERKTAMNAAIMEEEEGSTSYTTSTTRDCDNAATAPAKAASTTSFDRERETKAVLQEAMDRYLRSSASASQSPEREGKENAAVAAAAGCSSHYCLSHMDNYQNIEDESSDCEILL